MDVVDVIHHVIERVIGRNHAPGQFRKGLLHQVARRIVEIGRTGHRIEAEHPSPQNISAKLGEFLRVELERPCAAEKEEGHLVGIAAEGGQRDLIVAILQAELPLHFVKKTVEIGGAEIPVGDLGRVAALVGKGALLAPDHLPEKRGRRRLPLAFAPAQRRRGQGQRRKPFTTRNALGRSIGRLAQGHEPVALAGAECG